MTMKAINAIRTPRKTPLALEPSIEGQHQEKVHPRLPKNTIQQLPQRPHSDPTPLATSKLMTTTLMEVGDPLRTGTASQVPHSQRSCQILTLGRTPRSDTSPLSPPVLLPRLTATPSSDLDTQVESFKR